MESSGTPIIAGQLYQDFPFRTTESHVLLRNGKLTLQ